MNHTTEDQSHPSTAGVCRVLEPGEHLGAYEVIEHLGAGTMGQVYRARHASLGRKVALKTLACDHISDPETLRRFFSEARAACRVSHENVVDITDFIDEPDAGFYYFIMEYLEGESLDRRLAREGPLPIDECARIGVQIANGLEAVHDQGVIHRDLKPANVFLKQRPDAPDLVKLLDFGVSKLRPEAALSLADLRTTAAGVILGTPAYMAPEQASGGEVDERADIYSVGVILYEMVTGELPFDADSYGEFFLKLAREEPPPPSAHRPIDPALEALLLRCLEKAPDERPGSMKEVRAELAKFLMPIAPRPPEPTERPSAQPDRPRRRTIAAALVLAAAAALTGLLLLIGPDQANSDNADHDRVSTTSSRPAQVAIRIVSEPDGAEVVHLGDGHTLGRTPLEISLEADDQPLHLQLRKQGFAPVSQALVPDRDSTIHLRLHPTPGVEPADDPEATPALESTPRTKAPPAPRRRPSSAPAPSPAPQEPRPSPFERRGVLDPFAHGSTEASIPASRLPSAP